MIDVVWYGIKYENDTHKMISIRCYKGFVNEDIMNARALMTHERRIVSDIWPNMGGTPCSSVADKVHWLLELRSLAMAKIAEETVCSLTEVVQVASSALEMDRLSREGQRMTDRASFRAADP